MVHRNLILLWVLLFIMTGCAEFEHPLIDPKSAAADPALNGIWMIEDMTSLYVASKANQEHSVVVVSRSLGEGLRVSELAAYPVKIGAQRYLNIKFPGRAEKPAWAIVRYAVHDNSLELALIDHKYLREAIAGKRLRGFVRDTKCDFFISPGQRASELEGASKLMGILALNSLMQTICHERMEIPIVTADSINVAAFLNSADSQQRFLHLESPRRMVSW